jgi:nitroreductase
MTPVNPNQHPVIEPITERYSAYAFKDKPVETEKLKSLFEAARWAASSYNEQPWRYILATKEDPDAYAKALGCLVEANQGWARAAPVLLLTATSDNFSKNGKPNRVALHDLGQASAHLALQAAELGLAAHQMAGVDTDKVASEFNLPDGYTAQTAIAIGYPALTGGGLNDAESKARERKPFDEFVFGDDWGNPSGLFQ